MSKRKEAIDIFGDIVSDTDIPFVLACHSKAAGGDVVLWRGTRSQILGLLEVMEVDITNVIYRNNEEDE